VTVATMTSAPGGGPAFEDARLASPSEDASSLPSRLARLPDLDSAALRDEWRRLRRSEPPRISRDLLVRAIAYGLQEREFGGLPKWARQSLAGLAVASDAESGHGTESPKSGPPAPVLKPGGRLVREWHGRTHSVVVLDDAFEFEGRRYRSLTHIAREITGAHWSGPRFFGLTKRSAATAEARGAQGRGDLERVDVVTPPRPNAASVAAKRTGVGEEADEAVGRRAVQALHEGAYR
jgi:hypothetical protein